MGQLATSAYAASATHDLNRMFGTDRHRTYDRIQEARTANHRNFISLAFCTRSADVTRDTPRVQSLRFIASELARSVRWTTDDPSAGNPRKFLRWLTWIEAAEKRRREARKITEVIEIFAASGRGAVTISFSWNNDSTGTYPAGSFFVSVSKNSSQTRFSITITSTNVENTDLGGVSEED
jgi:hypothetical protein